MTADTDLRTRLRTLTAPYPDRAAAQALRRLDLGDWVVEVDGRAGPVLVAYSRRGISMSAPAAAVDREGFAVAFGNRFGRPLYSAARPPAGLGPALRSGRAAHLDYDLVVSPFTAAVLEATLAIPPGQVRPYAWVARRLGKPRAARAVGAALHANPVPVLIPCHRVVRSDGKLGGYAYGTGMKRELLGAEGVDVTALEDMGAAGETLVGSDTTGVFCYPTCHHARRITAVHRVAFSSPSRALAAGFVPCRHCGPA